MTGSACLAAALVLAAGAAAAQTPPPCSGHLATIRDSAVMPGMMPAFEKAVADQTVWYVSHNTPTKPMLLKILRRDPKTGAIAYADDEAMTQTIYLGDGSAPPHDAAWDAFVAEFRASSTIKTETMVCLPDK